MLPELHRTEHRHAKPGGTLAQPQDVLVLGHERICTRVIRKRNEGLIVEIATAWESCRQQQIRHCEPFRQRGDRSLRLITLQHLLLSERL